MAHVVQINAALLKVEFVQHTVIAHSQFEFGSALESLVREISELGSHLVDFSLDSIRICTGRESNALENVGDQI
jgi:hypothetical protein